MATTERGADRKAGVPALVIDRLDVHYGRAHVLQGVSLVLERGVLAIVGRNGMGKTTLCNALCGLVPASGSVKLFGAEIRGLAPHRITRRGIAYVPQGRRVWPSLSVDETLRLVAPKKRDVERIYAMFPRLAERKDNGGAQLSGGEAQMLAIGRALLLEPKLLVMDEPTEGLAPMIVEQVVEALRGLAAESEIAVLLIEQNLGVAIDVADRVGVMVNGRIAREMAAAELGADRELQERLLGLRSGGGDDEAEIADRAGNRSRADAKSSRCAARTATARRRSTTSRRERCAASTAGTPAARPGRWPTSHAARRRWRRRRATATATSAATTATRVAELGPGLRLPGRREQRPRGLCRRHLRHQGPRALLPAPVPREARPARRHRRPLDLGQAVDRGGPPARGRTPPSRRRGGGLQRRPRRRRHGDGARLRPLRAHVQRPRRPDRRRRLGRHRARHQRHARACRSACPRSWSRRSRAATRGPTSGRAISA